jgi:hypothetical protein
MMLPGSKAAFLTMGSMAADLSNGALLAGERDHRQAVASDVIAEIFLHLIPARRDWDGTQDSRFGLEE